MDEKEYPDYIESGAVCMDEELKQLLAKTDRRRLTVDDLRMQRISFAYGNALEDTHSVTKKSLKEADRMMRGQNFGQLSSGQSKG